MLDDFLNHPSSVDVSHGNKNPSPKGTPACAKTSASRLEPSVFSLAPLGKMKRMGFEAYFLLTNDFYRATTVIWDKIF
jgi:hypothetical protein